jgi:hypothetical protein
MIITYTSRELANMQYNLQTVNGIPILRSGSDFQQLSYIEARKKAIGGWTFSIERRDITSSVPEDPVTKDIVTGLSGSLQKKLQKPIGYSSVDLDARFSVTPQNINLIYRPFEQRNRITAHSSAISCVSIITLTLP